jgi:uncharacterized protein (DUF58 family)
LSTPAPASGPIDSAFLVEMEGLRLLSRKVFRGQMRGERRSRNRGQSVEFVDYRPYLRGDDLRRIDWNLYGRLERHFVKLFEEEEDLRLYILLDCSASMDYGSPSKIDAARRLAAALAYITLSNHETVQVNVFAGDYRMLTTPSRGKGKIHPLLKRLNELKAEGGSQLSVAASRFSAATRKNGLVVVISDFLMPEGIESIAPLLGGGHQIELVQVLAPEEANPKLTGDVELVDMETGEQVEVSMGPGVLRKYHQRLTALQSELKSFSRRGRGDFFAYVTSTPLKEFVMGGLRQGKLVR